VNAPGVVSTPVAPLFTRFYYLALRCVVYNQRFAFIRRAYQKEYAILTKSYLQEFAAIKAVSVFLQ